MHRSAFKPIQVKVIKCAALSYDYLNVFVLLCALELCSIFLYVYDRFTLLAEPFLTVHMLCTEKRLCTNPVKCLLSMLSALLSNSFEPRPNRCSFLTVSFRRTFRRHFYLLPAGSVSIIGLSQKLMLALEKPA